MEIILRIILLHASSNVLFKVQYTFYFWYEFQRTYARTHSSVSSFVIRAKHFYHHSYSKSEEQKKCLNAKNLRQAGLSCAKLSKTQVATTSSEIVTNLLGLLWLEKEAWVSCSLEPMYWHREGGTVGQHIAPISSRGTTS